MLGSVKARLSSLLPLLLGASLTLECGGFAQGRAETDPATSIAPTLSEFELGGDQAFPASPVRPLRVTTWNLKWFPSGSPTSEPPETEAAQIRWVAQVLNELRSDVIFLQDVRDAEVCERLACALGPDPYYVLTCSDFREEWDDVASRRQVAILAKQPTLAAWSEPWEPDSLVQPPGGFAFAVIRHGTIEVGLYGLRLKNNAMRGQAEREARFNSYKRETAASDSALVASLTLSSELRSIHLLNGSTPA